MTESDDVRVKPSLQQRIRAGVLKKHHMKACPACGSLNGAGGLRALTKACGVSPATLSRFLRGGDADGKTLDRLEAFINGR